jgi:hypothetical protein
MKWMKYSDGLSRKVCCLIFTSWFYRQRRVEKKQKQRTKTWIAHFKFTFLVRQDREREH